MGTVARRTPRRADVLRSRVRVRWPHSDHVDGLPSLADHRGAVTRVATALALLCAACAAEPLPSCYPEGAYLIDPGTCALPATWSTGRLTHLPDYEGREFEFDFDGMACWFTQVEPWGPVELEATSPDPHGNDIYYGTITWADGSCDVILTQQD